MGLCAPARRPDLGAPVFRIDLSYAVHGMCIAATLALPPATATAQAEPDSAGTQEFPALPLPPAIEGLIGMPQTYTEARSTYLAGLVTRKWTGWDGVVVPASLLLPTVGLT